MYFCTFFPLPPEIAPQDIIDTANDWIRKSPHYSLADQMLSSLGKASYHIQKDKESFEVIDDLLENNEISNERERIREELKKILCGYKHMTASVKSRLEKLGLTVSGDTHHKVYFEKSPEFQAPLAGSGSDKRGGMNCASDIFKKLV